MTTATHGASDQPSSARMYDYYLGNREGIPVNEDAAKAAIEAFPNVVISAIENRAFMARVIKYLTETAGVSQFLDLGSGIPTSPSPHELAQAVIPSSRVVYVDKNPDAFVDARLTGTPEGRVAAVAADMRDIKGLFELPEVRETLDLSQPVAVVMLALLHLIPDEENAYGIVRELVDALPAGSFITLTQATADHDPTAERFAEVYRRNGMPFQLRSGSEIERFFDTLELVAPGVQILHRWRPDLGAGAERADAEVSMYGGLGRKP
jgi:hypothetical protein